MVAMHYAEFLVENIWTFEDCWSETYTRQMPSLHDTKLNLKKQYHNVKIVTNKVTTF